MTGEAGMERAPEETGDVTVTFKSKQAAKSTQGTEHQFTYTLSENKNVNLQKNTEINLHSSKSKGVCEQQHVKLSHLSLAGFHLSKSNLHFRSQPCHFGAIYKEGFTRQLNCTLRKVTVLNVTKLSENAPHS